MRGTNAHLLDINGSVLIGERPTDIELTANKNVSGWSANGGKKKRRLRSDEFNVGLNGGHIECELKECFERNNKT